MQRAAAGSGVLAAGVLLAPLQQGVAWAAEGKDGTEQFGELRGELERKEKEEEASVDCCIFECSSICNASSRSLLRARGGVMVLDASSRGRRY